MSGKRGARELKVGALRWSCPAAWVREAAGAWEEVASERRRRLRPARVGLEGLEGQAAAVQALRGALEAEGPGGHVFVVGPAGVGRRSLVEAALREVTVGVGEAKDRVYVANFREPTRPVLLTLPRGVGRRLRRDVERAVVATKRAVAAALQREAHTGPCERLRRRGEAAAQRWVDDAALELREAGLVVGPVPEGGGVPELRVEVSRGRSLPVDVARVRWEAGEYGPKVARAVEARLGAWEAGREALAEAMVGYRAELRRMQRAVVAQEARVAREAARGVWEDVAEAYPTEGVRRWVEAVVREVGERWDQFVEVGREGGEDDGGVDVGEDFQVNLFVDASARGEAPVIWETEPSATNVLGGWDGGDDQSPWHMRLRAGSLALAGGGVWVVQAEELWGESGSWKWLRRVLREGRLEPRRGEAGARAEAIRLSARVVVVGSEDVFEAMWASDPEVGEVFTRKVHLEDEVPVGAEAAAGLVRGLMGVAARSGWRRPGAGALASLVEYSVRLSGRQDRMVLWYSRLSEVLREADQLSRARAPRGRTIQAADVAAALAGRRRRHGVNERRVQEGLEQGLVKVEVEGAAVGVGNALVVYDYGDSMFARPVRVSAAVGVGVRGVVDIEREAEFSGGSHHKGVQIVSGLLHALYAWNKPLCLTASVAFEQSYAVVDGDSASLIEVCVLLSALGEVPLDQRWGVTGSVSQRGEVQAVGEVSGKVEGFFALCQARGLTGTQGVLIPAANVAELNLRDEVVDAVRAGTFRIVAVETLEGALEVLSGERAGRRGPKGYPENSIHGRVDRRLVSFAHAERRFARVDSGLDSGLDSQLRSSSAEARARARARARS